jgi:curved DNA-binding protein CbpA
MSHYEVLGLPAGASAAAIRKAYRQRAKHEHPDKGGSDEQFQKLQQAYEVLANAGSRQQYDQTVMQERERRRRQAEARKQEEERLAKQAEDRARFIAQQRQRMVEQEKAEAALRRVDGWAAQPSPVLGSQSPSRQTGRLHQRGPAAGRARSAGSARQPGAGRGIGRGEMGSRSTRGYVGPTAHERARYGYSDEAPPRPTQSSGVYSGVTGMDSSKASANASQPEPEPEPVLFGSLEGRCYHKRHDCTELQMSSSVRTGTAYYFTVTEHKSRCPYCCASTETSEPSGGTAAGETRSGYSGPTPQHAQEYLRRKLARQQEEERHARVARERARYVGPTAQERARYGYSDAQQSSGISGTAQHASSPAASGQRSTKSGVERVVHGMSNIHTTLYGAKLAGSSPARTTLHPLAAMAGAGISKAPAWDHTGMHRPHPTGFTFV